MGIDGDWLRRVASQHQLNASVQGATAVCVDHRVGDVVENDLEQVESQHTLVCQRQLLQVGDQSR